jgi:putative ABC transport system permease protein
MGGVLLMLGIVCVNVANMLLVRATTRRSELAVRSALGAERGRIARQLLLESLLLALGGGAAGLALGLWGMKVLIALAPANLPRVAEAELNLPVLLFSLGVTALVGMLFGLAPVREASRLRLAETLKEGGWRSVGPGGAGRLQSGLVVAQFALAFVLLIAAGLMLRSLLALQWVDPGFDPQGLLTAQVSLRRSGYPDEVARRALLLPVLERLRVQPGVEAVGAISELHYSENFRGGTALLYGDAPDGREMVEVEADLRSVTDGYFDAMGAEITGGRGFEAREVEEVPPVVVIDRVLAERYWPGESPVGRRIDFGSDWTNSREIIGVVKHIQHYGPDGPRRPQVYFSYRQRATPTMSLTVRVSGDPLAATEMVRRAVLEGDPNQPITRVVPMQALVDAATAADRFYLRLLAVFGAIALVLAGLGIYALIAHSVTARLREIGVRMALGAGRGSVQWLFVRRALWLALLGAIIGGAGALAAAHFVAGLVHGVSARDPAKMLAVLLVLTAAAILAGYLPARAAGASNPARVLRDR